MLTQPPPFRYNRHFMTRKLIVTSNPSKDTPTERILRPTHYCKQVKNARGDGFEGAGPAREGTAQIKSNL